MAKPGEEIVEEKTGLENIEDALNVETKAEEIIDENKDEGKIEDKTPEQIEEERIAAEEAKKKLLEDPEFDLGLDEDGKTPLKLTRKQILEMKKSGMLMSDYTKKTQEIAAERANHKEILDIVDFLKKNPAKAERIVKILEEKAEAAAEVKVDLKKSMAEIEETLKDLPEDDPYAKVLRGQKVMLQEAMRVNQELTAKLDKITNGQKSEEQSKLDAECHQTLTSVMTTKQKALKFIDEKEAEYWKRSALTYLVNNPKEYEQMDKETFAKYFNEIGDKVYAEIVQLGEGRVNEYIKKKGGASLIPGSNGAALPAEKGKKPLTQDNLQEGLELALQEAEDKKVT